MFSLIWRTLFCLWWTLNMIVTQTINLKKGDYQLFFTIIRWGDMMCTIYSIVALLIVFRAIKNQKNSQKLENFSGILLQMATALSFGTRT